MNSSTTQNKPLMRIAVRTLVESVYKQGGLIHDSMKSEAAEGIRLHQYYIDAVKNKYGNAILSEYPLEALYEHEDVNLKLSGRCDIVHLKKISSSSDFDSNNKESVHTEISDKSPDSTVIVTEIKTHGLPDHKLPAGGDLLHWAQLKLYGYMYLRENKGKSLTLELVYLNIQDRSRKLWQKNFSIIELEEFFCQTCQKYMEIAGQLAVWQKLRDKSACDVTFPYQTIRSGQKELMKEVLAAIRQKGVLFAQAPTGTGKTMSTVFPAVRALGHHLTDHIFYLTAMTSTRQAAVDALNDLRAKGLHIRSLVLYAKEKICLEPKIFCDTANCPYAIMYYTNLPDAIRALLQLEEITFEDITACARHYHVCPFELSLDISLYCDFIICDYNYAFDPRVKLDRFFGSQPRNAVLLIDEAHNLPARSREMYSAQITEKLIDDAVKQLNELWPDKTEPPATVKYLRNGLNQLSAWFNSLREEITAVQPQTGFEKVEKNCKAEDSMKTAGFLAMKKKPQAFISAAGRCSYFIRTLLDEVMDLPEKKIWTDLLFSLLFFARIADMFDRGRHITTLKLAETVGVKSKTDRLVLELLCLDASDFVTDAYYQKRPAVFFSATLSPLSYYIGLMDSKAANDPPEQLILPSPFPQENLLLLVHSNISVRYKDREKTMPEILELILSAIRQHTGNYLVFVPSYAYLRKFRKLLKIISPSDMDCLLQIPGMSEELKQKYLSRFNKHGQKTLLAVAVMGSFFNEGIDLAGDKLSGVIIIGTGMPQLSPEREILKQYYDASIGSGFAYSYIYPGFNKVQQAAGRVIRGENDRGFVLLIDDRYEKYEYRQLFPHEWMPLTMENTEEICETASQFWDT